MLPLDLKILLGEAELPAHERCSSPEQQETISDWLDVNSLANETVLHYLEVISSSKEAKQKRYSGPQLYLDLSADEAWALCAGAMRRYFPDLVAKIDKIEAETPKCLASRRTKHPKAFTYDLGFGDLPFVSLHYQGRAADFLAMAHEFGHALQIVASWENGEGQMSPVARECCAFMAELAVIRHCQDRFPTLIIAHSSDDAIYFGEHTDALEAALNDNRLPYQFDWNYPLARHFAVKLFRAGETDHPCAKHLIFQAAQHGGETLARCIKLTTGEGLAA